MTDLRCRSPWATGAPVLLSVALGVAGGALLGEVPAAGVLLLVAGGLGRAGSQEAVLIEVVAADRQEAAVP